MLAFQEITITGDQQLLSAALQDILQMVRTLRGPDAINPDQETDTSFVVHWQKHSQGEIGIYSSERKLSMMEPGQDYQVAEIARRIQSNEVLSSFFHEVAQPVAIQHRLQATLTNEHQQIEDWYSPETASLLRELLLLVNPQDWFYSKHWTDLLVSIFEPNYMPELETDRLDCWLQEDGNLTEAEADVLMQRYFEGLGILQAYAIK